MKAGHYRLVVRWYSSTTVRVSIDEEVFSTGLAKYISNLNVNWLVATDCKGAL